MMLTLLNDDPTDFPDIALALDEPNGLLAFGGDLHPERLIAAYRQGIFPWFSDDDPIMWWSPDPRCIIEPQHYTPNRTLTKLWRNHSFTIRINSAFEQVITACSEPTPNRPDTWINQDMLDAYCQLHRLGHAHSVEVWHGDQLVGGLYGLQLNGAFCGESMFHRVSGASKIAFLALIERMKTAGMTLLDCQLENPHLMNLGATVCSRNDFALRLEQALLIDCQQIVKI
ncbi:leucyl/phenylalanyl-tRNA--protein transferase [Neiella marina]|uniref:Leucyl/phenylalanyl-tRNA--protein transferase n=1 Tax=Neiella holothuriorum TaxID=2870530 RepID=A0ABS7ELF7_9GAMM|nr:leucyl/phenylalanyl-tRNA--protein transferase [Neiella holothuriorum]MBW8192446.1 leucyl/phenylalanyl-tRNA--protein transferase [Neiella holothuriorum]